MGHKTFFSFFFFNKMKKSAPIWKADKDFSECALCTLSFTISRRKHHCRYCGEIVCDLCSNYRTNKLEFYKDKDFKRICFSCATELNHLKPDIFPLNLSSN